MTIRLSRNTVLGAIQDLGDQCWTTRELANALDTDEYRVRAAVSWLRLGRLVEHAGSVTRMDHVGRPYRAICYRWTGRSDIQRVPRDPDVRRAALEQPIPASAWLSRAW